MRPKNLLICLMLVLTAAGSALASVAIAATETRIPNAKINLDVGFVFDANDAGDYVIAWEPDGRSRFTRVLRGSVTTGVKRTWLLNTDSGTPDVSIASNGTMAVGWTVEGSGPNSYYRKKYGAVWNASDAKIKPHLLDKSRTEIAQDLGAVDVAINDVGTAAFAWQTAFPTERISVAIGKRDGTFSWSQRIYKNNKNGFLNDPEVSIDNAGRTTVKWRDLGLDCKEEWFVPKNCKNRASSLSYSQGSADFHFTPPTTFGKRCSWGSSDSNGVGQIFSIVSCRSGFHYMTSDNGQPFSGLQRLPMLGGNRDAYSPDVKLLKDGTIFVAYESLRYEGKVGPFSQIAGSRSAFGEPLGMPSAITAEVDYSDSENQGGYYSNNAVVLEGVGSQVYVAQTGFGLGRIGAIGSSGKVGTEISLPNGQGMRLAIAPGGQGLTVFTREKLSRNNFWVQLWTSSFALPSPSE